MNPRVRSLAAITLSLGASVLRAQTPTPPPARAPQEQVLQPPAAETGGATAGVPMEPTPGPKPNTVMKDVRLPGPPPDLSRGSANAGALKNLEAVRVEEGEARVRLDGVERTLRAGDTIAGDVVRRIDAGRLVLARSEGEEREALVVVSFDEGGRARVRVYTTLDPNPVTAPPLR